MNTRHVRGHAVGRGTVVVALAVTGALGLSACGGTQAAGSSKGSSSIVIGGYDYSTLDPGGAAYITRATAIAQDIYGTLFDPAPTGSTEPVPDLATGFKYSADYKTLTITLRSGLTFSDGTPLDASAVVANFQRYQKSSVNAQYFKSMTSAEASNPTTVVVTFSKPNATMVSALAYTSAGLIGSPTALQKVGADAFGLKPVGAGPFTVVTNSPAQELVLKRNPKYYNADKVKLNQIRYISTSPDAQVAYQQVASGSIDGISVSAVNVAPSIFSQAEGNSRVGLTKGPDNVYSFLAMNTYSPPFNNPKARQAIAYCTDRDSLAKNVQQGVAVPAYVLAGADSEYYPSGGVAAAKAQYPYSFDQAKGKALVQELGGLSFTFDNIGGQAKVISNGLAQQWKECGINAKVESILGPAQTKDFASGNYQMAYTNTGGVNDPAMNTAFLSSATPQGKFNFAGKYPDFEKLVAKTVTTTDTAVLSQTWQQIWSQMNQLAVNIPIMSGPTDLVRSKCLSGADLDTAAATFKNAQLTC